MQVGKNGLEHFFVKPLPLPYNQYDYSSKTLSSESGQDNFPSNTFRKDDDSKTLSRAELAKKLNISGDVHSKPILYGILEHFLAGRNENQMTKN